ncbi:MAG TPA: OsmC family protein [Aeromonadales bacterium]|nr:OsmC family protein [Aeromonadales bacterium]
MTAKVKWLENDTFVAETQSGHTLVMSGSTEKSPSPMELVLAGLGGCSSIDVVSILKKGRADIRSCVVELEAERADSVPKVFQKIHLRFVVTGSGLTEKAVERAVSLSADKYCSVSMMLEHSVKISHSFEIIPL